MSRRREVFATNFREYHIMSFSRNLFYHIMQIEILQVMNTKKHTKIVHEGKYAAEVDVELIYEEGGWSPYLSLQDAEKLDEVRVALRNGDVKRAGEFARIFTLTPVMV